jgi:hypothetical protein
MDDKGCVNIDQERIEMAADKVCQVLERVLNEAIIDDRKIRGHEIKGLPEVADGQAIEILYEGGCFVFSKLLPPDDDDDDDFRSAGIFMGCRFKKE